MGQVIGHGTTFIMGSATPAGGAWSGSGESSSQTTIVGVTSVDFGSNKVDTIDNTDMGTPGTKRTFIPGLENSGDISLKINVSPADATQAALRNAKGIATDFKVISPGATFTRSFSGILTSWDLSLPDDKMPTITAKIQVNGAITETNF